MQAQKFVWNEEGIERFSKFLQKGGLNLDNPDHDIIDFITDNPAQIKKFRSFLRGIDNGLFMDFNLAEMQNTLRNYLTNIIEQVRQSFRMLREREEYAEEEEKEEILMQQEDLYAQLAEVKTQISELEQRKGHITSEEQDVLANLTRIKEELEKQIRNQLDLQVLPAQYEEKWEEMTRLWNEIRKPQEYSPPPEKENLEMMGDLKNVYERAVFNRIKEAQQQPTVKKDPMTLFQQCLQEYQQVCRELTKTQYISRFVSKTLRRHIENFIKNKGFMKLLEKSYNIKTETKHFEQYIEYLFGLSNYINAKKAIEHLNESRYISPDGQEIKGGFNVDYKKIIIFTDRTQQQIEQDKLLVHEIGHYIDASLGNISSQNMNPLSLGAIAIIKAYFGLGDVYSNLTREVFASEMVTWSLEKQIENDHFDQEINFLDRLPSRLARVIAKGTKVNNLDFDVARNFVYQSVECFKETLKSCPTICEQLLQAQTRVTGIMNQAKRLVCIEAIKNEVEEKLIKKRCRQALH